MSTLDTIDATAFTDYLARHEKKSLLRFLWQWIWLELPMLIS